MRELRWRCRSQQTNFRPSIQNPWTKQKYRISTKTKTASHLRQHTTSYRNDEISRGWSRGVCVIRCGEGVIKVVLSSESLVGKIDPENRSVLVCPKSPLSQIVLGIKCAGSWWGVKAENQRRGALNHSRRQLKDTEREGILIDGPGGIDANADFGLSFQKRCAD